MNQQGNSSLELAHQAALDELKSQPDVEQNRRISGTCREMIQGGVFAVLEVMAERQKIDLFSRMVNTREEAELHDVRGAVKGVEDLLTGVFAEAGRKSQDYS